MHWETEGVARDIIRITSHIPAHSPENFTQFFTQEKPKPFMMACRTLMHESITFLTYYCPLALSILNHCRALLLLIM